MPSDVDRYTVMKPGFEITTEIQRKKSRFLTVMRRADSAEEAQELVDQLRRTHHSARHHCSAWMIGHDRRIQRANDDSEPSGTAGVPMLEALSRAHTHGSATDLSDVVAVVVRWFGGTLLGAGGLVSAYSDSLITALDQAHRLDAFGTRQRMSQFQLSAPIAAAGRWENELRGAGVTMTGVDYTRLPGQAVMDLAVPDRAQTVEDLTARVAALSAGSQVPVATGMSWVDIPQ